MSVLLETSVGDLTIDLFTEEAPLIVTNFLKLCKIKHYNNCIFHHVEQDFVAICGAEKGAGLLPSRNKDDNVSGATIWGIIDQKFAGVFDDKDEEQYIKYLPDRIGDKYKHDRIGIVATANERHNQNGSAFYITLGKDLNSLNGKHTIFGVVVEGLEDVLLKTINRTPVDERHRPLQPLRIRHTLILDDPLPDPPHLRRLIPSRSPTPVRDPKHTALRTKEDELRVLERISEGEARSRAIALEILGDIPDADMKPPDNVLFLCKLNSYTEEEDLKTIFSQFGNILSCNIIRDWKTGDSLQYGFIEFEDVKSCEAAYFRMQDVLIDDRRIHVDFCQSVSRQWYQSQRAGNRGTRQDFMDIQQLVDGQHGAADATGRSESRRRYEKGPDHSDRRPHKRHHREMDRHREDRNRRYAEGPRNASSATSRYS